MYSLQHEYDVCANGVTEQLALVETPLEFENLHNFLDEHLCAYV